MLLRPALLRLLLCLCLGLAALATTGGAAWAQDGIEKLRGDLQAARTTLDDVEEALKRETLATDELQTLRLSVEQARSALVALDTQIAEPRAASRARLDKLGAPPKAGEPEESADIKEARQKETVTLGAYESLLKDVNFQILRAEQDVNTLNNRRNEAFARQLFKRESSIADFYSWGQAFQDLPGLLSTSVLVANNTRNYFLNQVSSTTLLSFFLFALGGVLLARLGRYRIARLRAKLATDGRLVRLASAVDALFGLAAAALGWPFGFFVLVSALNFADLITRTLYTGIGLGIVGALLTAFVFDAMGEGVLQPRRPDLRLLPLSDWAVRRIRRRVRWMAIILGVTTGIQVISKALYAPIALTVAVTAVSALLTALVIMTLLVRLRRAPPLMRDGEPVPPEEDVNALDILRPIMWIAVIATLVCLLSGYIALGAFIASLPLALIFIACLVHLLMIAVDAGLTDYLIGNSDRRRAISLAIGVSPKNIAVAGTLLSGVLRFLIVFAALGVVAARIGLYSSDILTAVQRSFFGFQVGEITIAPSSILFGIFLFSILLLLTRVIRGWVRNTLLPRTALDAGLQNSIATIIGYVGIVLAITVGLSEIGLSLQNVAIVAGALSVGIGFGLQSIVSNFVSGLILLAERPIRVGDIIAAGGEEGFVRRISVRATEIETYDRATLIIPNSQLITGVVKNWVYGNTWSRVRIIIEVPYDADLDAVKAGMLGAAEDDPRILPAPQPRVFLNKMADKGLEFELVVVIASVETAAAVRSDLQIRILKGFRAKGIRLAAEAAPAVPLATQPVLLDVSEQLGAILAARDVGKTPPQS